MLNNSNRQKKNVLFALLAVVLMAVTVIIQLLNLNDYIDMYKWIASGTGIWIILSFVALVGVVVLMVLDFIGKLPAFTSFAAMAAYSLFSWLLCLRMNSGLLSETSASAFTIIGLLAAVGGLLSVMGVFKVKTPFKLPGLLSGVGFIQLIAACVAIFIVLMRLINVITSYWIDSAEILYYLGFACAMLSVKTTD